MTPALNQNPRNQHNRANSDIQFWNTCSEQELEERINEMDSRRFGRNRQINTLTEMGYPVMQPCHGTDIKEVVSGINSEL